jgi:hypothetical protein
VSRFLNPPLDRIATSKRLACALVALLLSAAGCSLQPSYSIKVTTADGVDIEVPLTSNPIITTSDEVISVASFRYVPLMKDAVTALGYYFELQFKKGAVPASVVIDDVTDLPIEGLIVDKAAKLVRTDRWMGETQPYKPADPHVNWVESLDNGIRVYRITVILKDGATHVLRLPILMPASTKAIFRAELGEK